MALKPIKVSELNAYVARILKTDPLLINVRVTGEVSGVNYHRNGMVYFDLKDDSSKIACKVSRGKTPVLPFRITDGMEVIITGTIDVYEKTGTYSLWVNDIEEKGLGKLAEEFLRMKEKLEKEGLFDPKYKKQLPAFPARIGIVTSPGGAAVKDILKNITARNSFVDVMIYPAAVQGTGAAEQIARAIDTANRLHPETDILIVGRGGGSMEELSPFNEECVARSIFASKIPVISAVGHEIDFSIADLVADVRAETPTKAGVIAVPDTGELADEIEILKRQFFRELENRFMYSELMTDRIRQEMLNSLKERLLKNERAVEEYRLSLELSDPSKIVEKGYAVIRDVNGKPVTGIAGMEIGDRYNINMKDGKAGSVIESLSAEV